MIGDVQGGIHTQTVCARVCVFVFVSVRARVYVSVRERTGASGLKILNQKS